MEWTTNFKRYLYSFYGFLTGVLVWGIDLWLEFNNEHLPLELWAFLYTHRIERIMIAFDLSPIIFEVIGELHDDCADGSSKTI